MTTSLVKKQYSGKYGATMAGRPMQRHRSLTLQLAGHLPYV